MKKHVHKSFVRQQDHSDCGVACLASILSYYGSAVSLERLRELSGTTKQGTTLLGLYQAANQLGLEAEGFEADMENLKQISQPVILHVVIDERLPHYLVCYGFDGRYFSISDPAKGLIKYSEGELNVIWQSKTLLQMQPTLALVRKDEETRQKKSWLMALTKEDLPILLLASLLGIAMTVLGLSTAIFSQKMVDVILPAKDEKRLTMGLFLLGILLVARIGLGYVRGGFLNRQSKDFNNRLINQFFGKLLHLPKSFFDSRKTGELIARMNDARRIQSTISSLMNNVVIDVLVLAVSTGFIFTYSFSVGFMTLCAIPLYGLLVWRYNQPIVKYQKEVMAAYARNESHYLDTIQGIAAIKAANKEHFFEQMTKAVYGSFQEAIYTLGRMHIRYSLLAELIGVGLLFSVTGWTSFLVLKQRLQLGEMMAILSMASSIVPSVSRLALINVQLQEALVAFNRMFEFAKIAPEYPSEENPHNFSDKQPNTIENLVFRQLRVENLSFRFPGRSQLLQNIFLEVDAGQMIAILGESGSGKSTLLQILQKFYPIESGSIKVNGQDWSPIETVRWRDTIGVVPQEVKLFGGTILDNICLGNTVQEAERILQFCQDYGFSQYFDRFPQGYRTLVGEEGINISGGQQQLVALVRALYRQPCLLLLDEATSSMDRNMERFVLNLLAQMQKTTGMSIILTTHRMQTARRASCIYVMDQGTIQIRGTHEELLRHENLYQQAWQDLILEPSTNSSV